MIRSGLKRRVEKREQKTGDFSARLVTVLDPQGSASEAYRALRTNLLYAFADSPPRVITVTSSGPREGKSTTCANLAVVLSQAYKKVLLVDCDFRRPTLHKVFELRNLDGLVNVLVGEREAREVWREPLEGLKVITSGPVPPNPAELLGSGRFAEFLEASRAAFDYVLLDAAPVRPVSDAAVVAAQGDGVLLVVDAQNTRKVAAGQSIRTLKAVGATVLGTVMNNTSARSGGQYGYGGGYHA
jgi:receptor protein-tyrosine kinase